MDIIDWTNERGGITVSAWQDVTDWLPKSKVNWRNFCLLTIEGEKSDYTDSWEIHIGVLGCHVMLTRWYKGKFTAQTEQWRRDLGLGDDQDSGNSTAECLSYTEEVAGSSPARSTNAE